MKYTRHIRSSVSKASISICLLLALLLSLPVFAAALSGDDPPVYDATDELIPVFGGAYQNFYYNDLMLIGSIGSTDPSGELALASVALAASAYDKYDITGIAEDMGFRLLHISEYYDTATTHDNCDVVAFSIYEKYVRYQEELYRILLLPVRGTPESCEWYSNFNLGSGDTHAGFAAAANDVFGALEQQMIDPVYHADHTLLWTMGHSRGAAVANIVAGTVSTSSSWQNRIPRSCVFGYTFACPAVSRTADATLKNIFNYNNGGDVIPSLPLAMWGYGRYGETITLPGSDYENLKQRYKQETGEDYVVSMATLPWENTFLSLAETAEEFVDNDIIQLGIDLVVYFMGGNTDPSHNVVDILLDHPSAGVRIVGGVLVSRFIPVSTLDLLKLDLSISALQLFFDDDLQSYLTLETQLISAITETSTMSDTDSEDEMTHQKYEEWVVWLSANDAWLQHVAELTGVTVQRISDLDEARITAGTRYSDYGGFVSSFRNVLVLFFEIGGNPVAPLAQGHSMRTYVLWVNSMYYGYRGWFENPDITVVNWQGRDQKTYAGDECFWGCENLASVTIPESVTAVGNGAFSCCSALKTLTMPVDLDFQLPNRYWHESYMLAAFYGCTSLDTIEYTAGKTGRMPDVSDDGPTSLNYCYARPEFSQSGDLYKPLRRIVFDEGVTYIGARAFANTNCVYSSCVNTLTEVVLPGTLTGIGEDAFYAQQKLTFQISEGMHLSSVGGWAFCDCAALTDENLTILIKDLTEIPQYCFAGCTGITTITIPESVTMIGSWAFADCTGMTSLTIPESVTAVGNRAFSCCSALETLTMPVDLDFQPPNAYYDNAAFYGCTSLDTIEYTAGKTGRMPDVSDDGTSLNYCAARPEFSASGDWYKPLRKIVFDEGVTYIGARAFANTNSLYSGVCTLTEVVLPGTLTGIGEDAFCGQQKLTFRLSEGMHLSSVGPGAFRDCAALTDGDLTKLLKDLTEIAECCFNGCTGITTVIIPDSVTAVGNRAFSCCSALETLTMPVDLNFQLSSEYSENAAFYGCTSLDTIEYTAGKTGRMPDVSDDGTTSLNYCAARPEFSASGDWYKPLRKIVFDAGVTYIGARAFAYTNGVYSSCVNTLTEVVLPGTLTGIGEYAFCGQKKLTFQISEGIHLSSVGGWAFCDCAALTDGDLSILLKDLTEIPECCFNGCTGITTVIIPDSVTAVGNRAFSYCSALETLTMPVDLDFQLSSEYSENAAFYGCTSLDTIEYTAGKTGRMPDVGDDGTTSLNYCAARPEFSASGDYKPLRKIVFDEGVTYIGARAFAYTNGVYSSCINTLTEVVLPGTLTGIGEYAFYEQQKLTFQISEGIHLSSVGGWAFCDCAALTDENLTILIKDLTEIPQNCFNGCIGITTVIIPQGVTVIGSWAFDGCTGITNATIGRNVARIGNYSFENCPLTDVYYGGSRSEWSAIDMGEYNDELFSASIHFAIPVIRSVENVSVDGRPACRAVIVCGADYGATAFAARYDASGRLLGVETMALQPGENTFTVLRGGAASVRFYVLDSITWAPLCEAKDSSTA